jgi:hypothetical protein
VTAAKDMTGKRFGKLTVISRSVKKPNQTEAFWICRCDCGNESVASGRNLRSKHTQSCGCQVNRFWKNKKDFSILMNRFQKRREA